MSTSTAVIPAAVAGGDIGAAIRREHAAATSAATAALGHALECGRLLAEAREGIEHGAWETFVRERCDIAPRTARVYLRLHANRERLSNRQHVAGLTVREAVRELTVPREEAVAEAEPQVDRHHDAILFRIATGIVRTDFPSRDVRDICQALAVIAAREGDPLGTIMPMASSELPAWYSAGMEHDVFHPESGWMIETWPHPGGEPFVHFVASVPGVGGFSHRVGMKLGIRDTSLLAVHELLANDCSAVHVGLPPHDDGGWIVRRGEARRRDPGEPEWNQMLFRDEDDYRQRGMGIKPRRKPRQGASA